MESLSGLNADYIAPPVASDYPTMELDIAISQDYGFSGYQQMGSTIKSNLAIGIGDGKWQVGCNNRYLLDTKVAATLGVRKKVSVNAYNKTFKVDSTTVDLTADYDLTDYERGTSIRLMDSTSYDCPGKLYGAKMWHNSSAGARLD